ncbi:MAG TPA: DUF302 domain-containing protein [Flavobacteriaceae bacterium]|nr:DUF302 domain-containing protein [Flavobacteriaceae bacterium]
MRFILSALVVALFLSCSSDDRALTYPNTPGLAYAESEFDFKNTYSALRTNIQQANYQFHKEIDFKKYAESYRRRSRETKMILFSNPSLEAMLIQETPEIGIEFPSRMLTYEDRDRYVLVAYNNVEYLSRMYGLNNTGAVQNMEYSLSQIASNVAGNMTLKNETAFAGINTITVSSTHSFNQVFNHLRNAIADNPEMDLIADVDHQLNALSVGVNIRANRVLLFTTGELEANMVDRHQLSTIDLPLRILVWEDENNRVKVSYTNLNTIKDRHQMDSNIGKLEEVKRMLAELVVESAN